MYKAVVWTLSALLCLVALSLGVLQTAWAKEKIKDALFALIEQEGVHLSIGSIEGGPPLKWTLHDVRAEFEGQTAEIKTLSFRVAIFPLLHKELSIPYFHIDEASLAYLPTPPQKIEQEPFPWTVAMKSGKIETLKVRNLATKEEGIFSIQGQGKIRKKGRGLSFNGKISSADLFVEGSFEGSRRSDHLEASLHADVRSKEAFSPFFAIPVESDFSIDTNLKGSWKNFPQMAGEMKLTVSKLDIPQLHGLDQNGFLEASFSLAQDRSFDFSAFSLKTDLLCAKGKGKFEADLTPKFLSGSFLLPHVSRLVPDVGGIVGGKMYYDGKKARFTFESGKLEVGPLTYTEIKGNLEAKKDLHWEGSAKFQMLHPMFPIEAEMSLFAGSKNSFQLRDLQVTAPETKMTGDLALSSEGPSGVLHIEARDLSLFSPFFPHAQIGGSLGGKLDFQEKDLVLSALVRTLRYEEFLSKELSIDCRITDFLTHPGGKLSFQGKTTYVGQLLFEEMDFTTFAEEGHWPFSLEARGKWKDPLELVMQGSWAKKDHSFELQFDTISGVALNQSVFLEKPCSIHWSDKALVVSECKLDLGLGYILGAVDLSTTLSKVHLKAEHFPIDLFSAATTRFNLKGASSLDVALQGTPENLQGRINVLLENADIMQAGKRTPIHSKGSLQINLDKGLAQVHGEIAASDEQYFELTATAPIHYQLFPLVVGFDRQRPIYGELTMDGHLEEIFDFINIGSHRMSGLLSTRLLLSKNLNSPQLQGNIELQGGSYENYFTGLYLEDAKMCASADGDKIVVSDLQAKDADEGTLSAQGKMDLKQDLPFAFEAKVDNLKILQLGWLSSAFSGPVQVTGNIHEALVKGEVEISRADITIPEDLPVDLPILPVTYINEPSHLRKFIYTAEPSFPFHYDTILHAKDQIFLTGRGLEAELEGALHVIGTNLSVEATGALRLLKGKFSFAGKDFTLTQGELTFPTSYLNLIGTLALPDCTVTAMLRGPLSSPQLTFQSSPALPTSSILARILFNKDISELSAVQALQLADTIVTLSGGAGPNVLETIRKSLGIDRLNISSTGGDADKVSVQIGKYLAKGVLITLTQSTESSQVVVEVELSGGFVLQAETQEDDQAKFSFKWNKNY